MKQKWIYLLLLVCMLLPFAALAQETTLTPAEQLLDGDTILYNNDVIKAGIEEAMYGNGDPTNRADVGKYARYVGIGLKSGSETLREMNETDRMPFMTDALLAEMRVDPPAGVVDLSCLQFCSKLTALVINCESVTGLEAVANINSLVTVYIRTKEPVDLTPLTNLKIMRTIHFVDCSGYSYTPLANSKSINALLFTDCDNANFLFAYGKPKITYLSLNNTPTTNFAMLATKNNLTNLTINNTDIEPQELSAVLSANNKMNSLTLTGINLDGATGLYDLKSVSNLVLEDCQNVPVDPEGWKNLSKLQRLYITNSGLTDCAFVTGLNKVKYMDLSYNAITDVTPFESFTKMDTLKLGHNSIEDATPLLNITFQYGVELEGNPLDVEQFYMAQFENASN